MCVNGIERSFVHSTSSSCVAKSKWTPDGRDPLEAGSARASKGEAQQRGHTQEAENVHRHGREVLMHRGCSARKERKGDRVLVS